MCPSTESNDFQRFDHISFQINFFSSQNKFKSHGKNQKVIKEFGTSTPKDSN